MKRNLIVLTGIVLVLSVLVAVGCKQSPKQNGSTTDDTQTQLTADSTEVDIYLKDTLIDGSMHLEMYDSKDTLKKVIDSLYTVVYPGYTVTWKKAHDSNIKDVLNIHPVKDDGNIFGKGVEETEYRSLYKLEIPPDAKPGTAKYEIYFTVKKDTTTWFVDPYLKIPDIDQSIR